MYRATHGSGVQEAYFHGWNNREFFMNRRDGRMKF